MRVFLLLGALAIGAAGCAGHGWTKAGVKEERLTQDLTACDRLAEAALARDRRSRGPSLADPNGDQATSAAENSTSLTLNLQHYGAGRDKRDLVHECMTDRGYIEK
ncbi:MAG TPA: hypothetical protein VHL08_06640 [Dongiaceae bacterium]|jgi:hypothetical protein|nr:hypothetical protein [Dongiaceae bacterium]